VRRRLALLTLAATLFAVPAAAAAKETVTVTPKHGDVNTRFVYRGSGWRPNAKVALSHGVLCGTGPCILPLYFRVFHTDADGAFRVSERPAKRVPDDFAGYDVCFSYSPDGNPGGPCKATVKIGVAPPSASATPAKAERFRGNGLPVTITISAEHFKAGRQLWIHLRYPDGRHKVLRAKAHRHGAYVGPANAWSPRGGIVKFHALRPKDPDGLYHVRVVDKQGHVARTSFVAQHYAD
jgi:hypothetical protein